MNLSQSKTLPQLINSYHSKKVAHFTIIQAKSYQDSRDFFYSFLNQIKPHTNWSNHPDFYLLEESSSNKVKSSNYSVEQINQFLNQFPYQPRELNYKIFLISDLSMLGLIGSNKLLKLLEEPGNYNIIFALSNQVDNVLPTVLSRALTIKVDSHKNQAKKFNISSDQFDNGLRNGEQVNISFAQYFLERMKVLNLGQNQEEDSSLDKKQKNHQRIDSLCHEIDLFLANPKKSNGDFIKDICNDSALYKSFIEIAMDYMIFQQSFKTEVLSKIKWLNKSTETHTLAQERILQILDLLSADKNFNA